MSDPREFAAMPEPERMSLSTAIRLGALLQPQVFGRSRGTQGGSCALMGALDAAGLHWLQHQQIAEAFPLLANLDVYLCPSCLELASNIGHLIVHLNDAHRWTREQIADQIAAIEHETETVNV